jgi:hypothetical protein
MKEFTAKFGERIQGVVSGLDRLVLRGSLRRLCFGQGMEEYLWQNKILFKDYAQHVKKVSEQVKKAAVSPFVEQKLPVVYLRSGHVDKEKMAQALAAKHGITSGDVCAMSSLEPSPTFEHYGTHMVARTRPCLVIYHYRIDPEWGWMNARIQTWFPMNVQVCLNGREWLARQMDREGLKYYRQDNCFPWLEDYGRVGQLLQDQLKTDWAKRLQAIAERLNGRHEEIFQKYPTSYYWTCFQCEWATDVGWRSGELKRLEPLLIQHGMLSFSSPDILRFLGRRIPTSGTVPIRFTGELTSDLKVRQEGARIKHRINGNSLKGYGKAHTAVGDVFRVETTTNQVKDFRVYRPKEGGPEQALAWLKMRRGIADLHRRAEVSQSANERYLNALSQVDDSTRLQELIEPLEQPVQWKGKRVRALHPFQADDRLLLEAVNRGEFAINGLRNRDLQKLLYGPPAQSPQAARKRSAAVSRKLRLLRAHGVIQKVPKTHRYQVTSTGRLAILAILAAQNASLAQLRIAA